MTITIQEQCRTQAHVEGYAILASHGTLIVGMSPGNSYFDEATVYDVLRFASAASNDVRVMIPDVPAVHTLRAIGEKRPEREARLAGNNLQNKCARSINRIVSENPKARIKVIEWKDDIALHPQYIKAQRAVRSLYQENETFRADARETTKAVVAHKYKGTNIEGAIDEAVNYLLDELAFLSVSPAVLSVEQAAYVYHHHWPIFENLINGIYDGTKRKNIGTIIAKK